MANGVLRMAIIKGILGIFLQIPMCNAMVDFFYHHGMVLWDVNDEAKILFEGS